MDAIKILEIHEQGRSYVRAGEHLKAIDLYTRAIVASPFWLAPQWHWDRGESYAALGRYEEAIADYEVPFNDDVGEKSEGERRWRLVALLGESQQPDRAVRALHDLVAYCTTRIKYIPLEHRYYYERARARAELKEYSEATADCRQALAVLEAARAKGILQRGEKPDEADIKTLRDAILAKSMLSAPPPPQS
jgi:tetratricopeptide (TPR) repeat protein